MDWLQNPRFECQVQNTLVQWKGEKCIVVFFFELEKRHFNSKTIRNLKIDDNTTLNTDKEILNEAKRFYQALYTSDNSFLSKRFWWRPLFCNKGINVQ